MAIISLSFRGEKSTHRRTQALFQTLKSELKFPWETQPHHPFLHASTRHVDWPESSPISHFLFCHLLKTICFPHVSNCADSRSVCNANKSSSIAGCGRVNTNVIIQTSRGIQSMKYHTASTLLTFRWRQWDRNLRECISICFGIYQFGTLWNPPQRFTFYLVQTPFAHDHCT